jgi:hypothetical protein
MELRAPWKIIKTRTSDLITYGAYDPLTDLITIYIDEIDELAKKYDLPTHKVQVVVVSHEANHRVYAGMSAFSYLRNMEKDEYTALLFPEKGCSTLDLKSAALTWETAINVILKSVHNIQEASSLVMTELLHPDKQDIIEEFKKGAFQEENYQDQRDKTTTRHFYNDLRWLVDNCGMTLLHLQHIICNASVFPTIQPAYIWYGLPLDADLKQYARDYLNILKDMRKKITLSLLKKVDKIILYCYDWGLNRSQMLRDESDLMKLSSKERMEKTVSWISSFEDTIAYGQVKEIYKYYPFNKANISNVINTMRWSSLMATYSSRLNEFKYGPNPKLNSREAKFWVGHFLNSILKEQVLQGKEILCPIPHCNFLCDTCEVNPILEWAQELSEKFREIELPALAKPFIPREIREWTQCKFKSHS